MFRPFPTLMAAALIAAAPFAALADKPAHAGKNGHAKVERTVKHKGNHAQKAGAARKGAQRDGSIPVVVRDPVRVVQNCPPGLAKKNPPCVPPGQAKKRIGAGTVIDWRDVHVITRPGLYGLTDPPAGQRYAIVDGRLVRIDRDSSKILSIIRLVDAILD